MKKRNPEYMSKAIEEEFKVEKYKSHYIIPALRNLDCSMKIFSYLWTHKEAPQQVSQINSKGRDVMKGEYNQVFAHEFSKHSKTETLPRNDVLFDDFLDLKLEKSKETYVHSITFYHTPMKIVGFEIEYYLDGGVLKSVNHVISPMALFKVKDKKPEEEKGPDLASKLQKNFDKIDNSENSLNFTKTAYYLQREEYIVSVKLRGTTHINKIEMKTNLGKSLIAGGGLSKDLEVDLAIPAGKAVIGFAGVIDGFDQDCRLLNLSAYYKAPHQDNIKYKSTNNYRDLVEKPFTFFDVMRDPEYADKVAKLNSISVFPGEINGQATIGGIEIEYVLTTGEIYLDGMRELSCKTSEEYKKFELKDNEGLINVEGMGTDAIKKISFESSFGRKVKQGMIAKFAEMSENDGNSQSNWLGALKSARKRLQGADAPEKFVLQMPVGSKVIGFGGTADEQIRCIYAYYKS